MLVVVDCAIAKGGYRGCTEVLSVEAEEVCVNGLLVKD
jgi:hypothetical protein